MLNTVRHVSVMLCYLEKDATFGGVVSQGWNQIKKINDEYCVFRLNDLYNPYMIMPQECMPDFLRLVCRQLINSGYMEDVSERAPVLKVVGI